MFLQGNPRRVERKGIPVIGNSMSKERYGGAKVCAEILQRAVIRETNAKRDGRGAARAEAEVSSQVS